MKNLHLILLLSICVIASMHSADDIPRSVSHPDYGSIHVAGNPDGDFCHSITTLEEPGLNNIRLQYSYCTFNKYGTLVNAYPILEDATFDDGQWTYWTSMHHGRCRQLQAIYNTFHTTYLKKLEHNRNQRTAELNETEKTLIAAKEERDRINDKIANLEKAHRLIVDSLTSID